MKTTGRQWAGRTAVVGTVFIALGAFWLSFTWSVPDKVDSCLGCEFKYVSVA